MLRYALRRLQHTVLVLVAISAISFFFIHLSGDPVMLMLPQDASAKEIEEMRARLGFNDPIYIQYGRFLAGALTGDLGQSLYY
ncbi:MAG: ABC transporter permease, partial [Candidatus Binatia bacterium]